MAPPGAEDDLPPEDDRMEVDEEKAERNGIEPPAAKDGPAEQGRRSRDREDREKEEDRDRKREDKDRKPRR